MGYESKAIPEIQNIASSLLTVAEWVPTQEAFIRDLAARLSKVAFKLAEEQQVSK